MNPTHTPAMNRSSIALALATWRAPVLAAALACVALPATALYKVVGPDGRITYTDRPPSDTGSRVTTLSRDGVSEVAPQDTLPLELRQATTRFPVTLYSAADCAPCDAGRQLLVQRGVPFTEKRIISDDDAAAMERVFGARTVPALTVGTQGLRGLSQTDWNAYLDAAGYPRESRLPKGWQPQIATPLVERSSPRAAAAAASAPVAAAPAQAAPSAPAGIRF
jgi:glutaredoxin